MAKGKKGKANGRANGATKPPKSDVPKRGHNIKALKSALKGYSTDYNHILNKKEEENGRFMSRAKDLIERAANETGLTRRIVRTVLQEARKEEKRRAKESQWDPDEQRNIHKARGALDIPQTQLSLNLEAGGDEEGEEGGEAETGGGDHFQEDARE